MIKASFVVDGFNLYHSLQAAGREPGANGHGFKWLNLRALCQSQLNVIRSGLGLKERLDLGGIYHFTSLPVHLRQAQPDVYTRHEQYMECLKATGVTLGLGKFHLKPTYCPNCSHTFEVPEEKQTDLNIGVKIVDLSVNNPANVIVLVSGDSDICPSIRWAKVHNEAAKIVIMFPFATGSKELRQCSDFTFNLKSQAYKANQLPDPFVYAGGQMQKPPTW